MKNNRKYKKRTPAPNLVTTSYGTINKTLSKHRSKEQVLFIGLIISFKLFVRELSMSNLQSWDRVVC